MLRKFMLLAAGVVTFSLAACNGTAPTLTFQQQVAIACGAAQGEIAILTGDGVFTGGAADTLSKTVQPDIDKVCAVGATITKPDLQTIVNATLPLVKSFVDASALAQDKKNVADAAIDSGVLAFNVAINLVPAVTATTASATVAASAPVAAGQ
ncbi:MULTISPECIES: hypothetical protein [unclassified Paraburkholderia]|uniref:hypothetical protein n=1 Tax=unclassified Paraburkholderia TaxID=2615204 RepID=UPI00161349F7|nr:MULTISPECIES: hypothetical protein [unclassified Paraburkholderia]MBB5444678.1 hypothetical protein [Paraburkholderia sp. WSM4177]MBB5485503.1 hypothetical protein [Paraburkholderia sp. WSM4180]